MPIRALIFDFDGLIIDTEWVEYQVWLEIYHEHGVELPLLDYAKSYGSTYDHFHPGRYLAERATHPLDVNELRAEYHRRADPLIEALPVLPGVREVITKARLASLRLAIASSSKRAWVTGHLERQGLRAAFESLSTSEDVSEVKPNPALYRAALRSLNLAAEDAVALEDSPNGVRAAKDAGLYCVAIPTPLSSQLDLSHADLILSSLHELPLERWLSIDW